jgi:hypothetical protein
MNPFDPKLLEKFRDLENLDAIEARLASRERKSRMALIAGIVLVVTAFALLLGHFAPSVVVPPALRFHFGKGLTRNSRPSPSSAWIGSNNSLIMATSFSRFKTKLHSGYIPASLVTGP